MTTHFIYWFILSVPFQMHDSNCSAWWIRLRTLLSSCHNSQHASKTETELLHRPIHYGNAQCYNGRKSAALSAVHLLEQRNNTCALIHPHSNYYIIIVNANPNLNPDPNAQCYGQFGELKDWWPKLLLSVRQAVNCRWGTVSYTHLTLPTNREV